MDTEKAINLFETHLNWMATQKDKTHLLEGAGYFADFAKNTLLVLEAAEDEEPDIPHMPDAICPTCDD